MATAIQVTLCILYVSTFTILFTGVSALVLEVEIPSDTPAGFKITKLGCTGKDVLLNTPGNEIRLFSLTESGDLILKRSVKKYENEALAVYITRLSSTTECQPCGDIPQISSLIISVKAPSRFVTFQHGNRELHGYLDISVSTEVFGKDINDLFENFEALSPSYSLIGSTEAADLFEFQKDTNGRLYLHLSSSAPECRVYYLICRMVTSDNTVLFTDLRIVILNGHGMVSAVRPDMSGTRDKSVMKSYNDLRTQDHDLTVTFEQHETMTGALTARLAEPHHRQRRQVKTAAVTASVNEGTTGFLYNFTRQGSGTTFQLKQAVPDMVEVNTNGQVYLKPGQVLDYDNGPKDITVEVYETTGSGATAEYEHTLTLTVLNINDEIPKFTNVPRPMLATVNAWAPVGTVFYTLTALDQDPGSTLGFYLEGTSSKFEVAELTGEVMTKAVLTQDYDEVITVYCKDTSVNPGNTEQVSTRETVSITTKYRSPQFYLAEYYGHIPENAQPGQSFDFQNSDSNTVELQTVNFQNGTTAYSIINPLTLRPSEQFDISQDRKKLLTLRNYNHEDKAQYNLLLQATDSASKLSSTVSLTVKITDINEFDPVFPLSPAFFVVKESLNVGDTAMTISATDKDTSSTITYDLVDDWFEVQSVNNAASIKIKQRLDYENTPNHMLTFTLLAVDDGGILATRKTSSLSVIVEIENVNTYPPVFVDSSMSMKVLDDADAPGASIDNKLVLDMTAYDPDGDGISYRFGAGNHSIFDINPHTGIITLKTTANVIPDNVNEYNFEVLAVDDNGCCNDKSIPLKTATAPVTVYIVDAVNRKPRFNCNYKPQLLEEQSAGTHVVTTTANDTSRGDKSELVYSLRPDRNFNSSRYFTIDKKTGDITTTQVMNREEFYGPISITVMATDRGDPPLSDLCTFVVELVDTNDNTPRFTSSAYSQTLYTGSSVGTVGIVVLATDADIGENARLTYELTQNPGNYFAINDNSNGVITIAQSLSTATSPIQLVVTARDNGSPSQRSSTATITMTLQSDYEPPSTSQSQYTFTMNEVADIGTVIGSITVTSNAQQPAVSLQIVNNDNNLFGIRDSAANTNGGFDIVINKERVQYELYPTLQLVLRASNEQPEPQNTYVLINIQNTDANMQIPTYLGEPYISADNYNIKLDVLEGLPAPESVGSVVAIDEDFTPAFRNVTYYEQSASQYFSINSMTGEITTKKEFDAEQEQIYYFSILAKDGAPSDRPNHQPSGSPNSATATVQIQISDANDNAPTFSLQQYAFSVPEDVHILTSVGDLTATDVDSGHVFRFTMDCSISIGVIPFAVNWTSGVIYVSGKLDYETTQSYNCIAKVFDGKYTAQTNVNITVLDVNDNPPTFSQSKYTFSNINEGDYRNNPFWLGQVMATDADTGRVSQTNIRYSILTAPGDTSISSTFELDPITGNLTVKGILDRESQPTIAFIVSAVDEPSSSLQLTSYATVEINPRDMNDNSPEFDNSTLQGSVREELPSGTDVMTVIAIDIDSGPNGEVAYALVATSDPAVFVIPNRNLGQIKTNARIDREQNAYFEVPLTAQDGATGATSRTTTGTATIYVIDINDNSPRCNDSLQAVTIPESQGGAITAVHAYDPDVSDVLSYKVSVTDFVHFATEQIDSVAYLVVHNKPDYDVGEIFFNVSVTVSDGVNTDVCYVQVTVEDVNDNAPVFSDINLLQDGNFSESTAVNTVIANFTASDIDSGDNKIFEFFILLESDPNKYFKIENLAQNEGQVQIQKPLDRETVPSFDLTILAIDLGSPPQTGTTILSIFLGDVNDNGPRLRETQISIKENLPPQTDFTTLYAFDPDLPENGPPFSFESVKCDANFPTVCGKFDFSIKSIASSLGGQGLSVSSLTSLDREVASRYLVDVVIKDRESVSATSTLTILIEGENDNINTDAKQSLFAYNYNGILENVVIGRVGFNDLDGDEDRATKTFEKLSDYTNSYVSVKTNGSIEILRNVPYGEFDFKVRVVDSAVNINGNLRSVTSTTTVTVKLEELDEEAPYKAGSVRIGGTTAAEFIKTGSDGESHYDKFRQKMADKLGKPVSNVQILTILDKGDEQNKLLEVRFAAHGSPYYTSARLNGIVTANKGEFQTASGGTIETIGVSECLKESCEGGCWDKLVVENAPNVINAGTDTKVGVISGVVAQCGCRVPVSQRECTPDYCFNDGQCVKDDYGLLSCLCKDSFDGPRCQNTKKGFDGTGYALFKPLEQCLKWETNIEFITARENGLIFYNGPLNLTNPATYTDPTDYVVLQLRGGYPELTVDLGTGALTLSLKAIKLSDGKWHHINIRKDGKMIVLTLDYCKSAVGGNRSSCEVSGYTKSTHMYLNVNTPLQLGGLSPSTINTPTGVTAAKFSGCMKNLRHKGELYDLHTGDVYDGVKDTCSEEDQACQNKCGDNGECVITDISTKTTKCVCDPGYRGSNCDTSTTVVDFGTNSFMEWRLVDSFANGLTVMETELQLRYRSRDQEGVLFHLSSSDTDRFMRLEIMSNILMLVYNLGGDEGLLPMPGVAASDGQWHTINIKRVSKTIIMTMDGGEGPYYVTTHGPTNSQGEITLLPRQIYAGAEVRYADNTATTGVFEGKDFNSSCYNDVRLETAWFPMTTEESNNNNDVKLARRTAIQNNCVRNDCVGISCPSTYVCKGLWEAYACVCPLGKVEVGNTCVDINYCLDSPCLGTATCRNGNGTFICDCPPGWKGTRCNQLAIIEEPEVAAANIALIVGIIAAVVIVLIIAFLVILLFRRCSGKDDMTNLVEDEKEDYEIRENIVAYDEEGAGEEDHEGYDLNRLRKPMDMSRVDKPLMNMENERPVKSGPPHGPGIGEFIGDRLGDADEDPGAPPYDTLMELNYEGGGSSAGSLSSLNTSSSGGDQDYDYLNNWGPKFAKLADMYNQYEDSD